MIKSMTGYGRGRVLADGLDITFEIKSVNNRYMDLNIRMPRAFAPLEERVKALVGAAVSRGKVDVYIGVEHLNGECVRLSLNREYLEGYLAVLGQVGKEYGIPGEVTLDMVAARSEVFLARKAEEDAEKVWPLMERAAREALDAFAAMRGEAKCLRRPARPSRRPAEMPAGWTPLRPRRCARPTRRCSPACASCFPA
ncbi:MAG: YicC/YloC family endoribonuclease [Acutalibacteraceae bacterium]